MKAPNHMSRRRKRGLDFSSKIWQKSSAEEAKMGFGDYPIEYNPKVHGPYDPARFYGKRKKKKNISKSFYVYLNWR